MGYHVIRNLAALVLLAAAGLKAHQLATEPVVGAGLFDSRSFLIAAVEVELFFGLWLLAGVLPKVTWLAALGCFGVLTCVSLYKALAGYASCGCFGSVQLNPWYTTALDLIIVVSLLCWRPTGARSPRTSFRQVSVRAVGVGVVWLTVGLPAALEMGSYSPATLSEDGGILGNDNIVVLEPEKWISKRFPLLDYIDVADRLKEGNWLVVLFHHDCPKCLAAISKYEELAHQWADDPTAPRVAMVEMPPFGLGDALPLLPNTRCVLGRLSEHKTWFVETPVVVSLQSAVVKPVTEG